MQVPGKYGWTVIVVTTNQVPGRHTEKVLGMVRGNGVGTRHIGKDIFAAFTNVVGGEISEYAQLMSKSRELATQRKIAESQLLGADAILVVRSKTRPSPKAQPKCWFTV